MTSEQLKTTLTQDLPLIQHVKSPERLTKIATADYISSHPGGVLGEVFNQQ